MLAFVHRNGLIGFGEECPEGCLPMIDGVGVIMEGLGDATAIAAAIATITVIFDVATHKNVRPQDLRNMVCVNNDFTVGVREDEMECSA